MFVTHMHPTVDFRITRARAVAVAACVFIFVAGVLPAAPQTPSNIVIQWNDAALQGVRDSKIGPPMVARALAIVHTCIYDAWAAYDSRAIGTRLGGTLRRPPEERTTANKDQAISFAAYRALVDVLPLDQ